MARDREILLDAHPPGAIGLYAEHLPAGDGATPAVQMTVLLAIRSPATTTPSGVDLIDAAS